MQMDFYKQLTEEYRNYKRNKEINGFKIRLYPGENETAKILVRKTCPVDRECYEAFRNLVTGMLNNTVIIGMHFLGFSDVEEKDYEDYASRWMAMFERNRIYLLTEFLRSGPECYLTALCEMEQRLRFSYLITHLVISGDRIFSTCGFEIVEDVRAKKSEDGKIIFTPDFGLSWKNVLKYPESERKKLSDILFQATLFHGMDGICFVKLDRDTILSSSDQQWEQIFPYSDCLDVKEIFFSGYNHDTANDTLWKTIPA